MLSWYLIPLILCTTHAFSEDEDFDHEWHAFKTKFNKKYRTKEEDQLCSEIYSTNKLIIYEHNRRYAAGKSTFKMGINQFADLTNRQYRKYMNDQAVLTGNFTDTFLEDDDSLPFHAFSSSENRNRTAPKSKDWRKEGAVTSVKNQGLCGSCWAFSAVGCLEAQYFLKTGNLIEFSVQNLIDCSFPFNNRGCNGGNAVHAYNYVLSNGGINTDSSYPYEGVNGPCRYTKNNSHLPLQGFGEVIDSEEDLKEAVGIIGPVVVSLDISLDTFRFYKSGILNDPKCGLDNLGHSALVVGYDSDENGSDYWIVKNSFGTDWGDEGYVKVARNEKNMCGISTEMSFVFK